LSQYGIPAAASRNSALISLAADLPAPIIADLFGLHPGTATRWSTYARADWSDTSSADQCRPRRDRPPYKTSALETRTMSHPGDPDIPDPAERAARNAALFADNIETGLWEDQGRVAPWPETSTNGP
jgi:hypothetical protein